MASGRGSMDWASMPADLLHAVFARLTSDADRIRFRAVCRGWATAAAAWRPRPWLVGSCTDRSGRGSGAISSFWLAPGGGLVPFPAAVPAGLQYLSSSRGYLALADPAREIVLVNPVTGTRVRLPPIGFFRKWLDVTTVVLSADPAAAAEWGAVAVGFPTSCLAHYSSATGAWRKMDFSAAGYVGVQLYRGRFYVAFGSQLCVCEVDGDDAPAVIPFEHVDEDAAPAVFPLEHVVDWDVPFEHVDGEDGDGSDEDESTARSGREKRVVETHLVERDGELLLVSVHDVVGYSSDDDTSVGHGGGDARTVEMHRVEWLGDGAVRLVREADLGSKHALFLGRNAGFALSPEEFPACRANCVYLVDRQGHPDGLVRVVDMAGSQWSRREETIFPDDGRRGLPALGWARHGWFFPDY